MTLRGDDTTGETLHPAAVALGILLYVSQVRALAQLIAIVLPGVISLCLPADVIALGLALLLLNLLLSARLAIAVLGQSRPLFGPLR